ncbi:NAD(P)H-dependent oxidoreductase [Lentibacillus saliphilus]|uniref:NAD(P)H-dependent oxidoreductase n=1 Tax=Lentibacillus saliphilus TaxID=2737028 RepID=UPI001C2F1FC3|nr:NAD(P)H-dependent oxidoreductase [Lentibacillus saliphilus]
MTDKTTLKKEAILAAYQFRHATKVYDESRRISEDDFKFILEAGRLSPSSIGSEPWTFLVVQNPDLRKKIMPFAPGAAEKLRTASHFVIILARRGLRYDSEHLLKQMQHVHHMPTDVIDQVIGRYQNFQAQNDILDNERTLFDWASKQTYIALGNMLTAAALIGIDSTPMEGFNRSELEVFLEEEGLLDREKHGVSVMAAFGYRKADPVKPKTRQPLDEIVKWV